MIDMCIECSQLNFSVDAYTRLGGKNNDSEVPNLEVEVSLGA